LSSPPNNRHVRGDGSLRAAGAFFLIAALTLTALAQTKPPAKPHPRPAPTPSEDSQIYRNAFLGFRYEVPYGWVNRTSQMHDGSEPGKSEILLAVFERPPEAAGDTVNSAVVIASESASSYPGLKTAEDYLDPLTELASQHGFKPEGEPSDLQIDSRQLLRADFSKTLGGGKSEGTTKEKLTMRQCTLVLLTKGEIVSFTFIAGSEDELDNLIEGLHFAQPKPPAH
jgi:hypothetical protein